MQNYHKHSWFTNTLVADCPTSYESYVERAREFGHKVISSVEHGFQSNYYVPYELVEKNNEKEKKKYEDGLITKEEYEHNLLKFVFGVEAYWVKDRKKVFTKETKTGKESEVKDMSNCHIVLLAKNEEGRRDINEALSDANIDGYYKQPRLDFELLFKIKPENVFVTTACIAYWKYDDIEEITEKFHQHFGENFFLEIQCHNTDEQKSLNKRILEISKKYGIDIIFGYDSHYIKEEDYVERNNYISTRRKNYDQTQDSETGWYMDYPNEETVRNRLKTQGILNDEEIDRCIKNTDLILDFDDLYFNKDIKLPNSYKDKTQDWKNNKLRELIYTAFEEAKKYIDESRYEEYAAGIEYELNAIIDTNMTDYFLIDNKIVNRGIEKGGIITKTGRGSGVSYYVNSLLGFSDIDRFISPVKLYPDRFMSKTRILKTKSLPDLDLNLGTPEIFAEAQEEIMGVGHAYPMISYKPLQKSSAFKLYAKSQGLDYDLANEVTSEIKKYEKALKHADTQEEKEALSEYDFVDKKYHKLLDESKKYQGIINAKSQAPCGYLIYDGDIKREIGLIRCVSETQNGEEKKSVITTVIDGMVAENYKFVKNDLLKVDIWLTINKIFEKVGIDTYSVKEITDKIKDDAKTWKIYEDGFTLGINQCESDFGRSCSMRYKPKNIQELTALVSALRPGFKTQLENFLNRNTYSTGVKALDELLEDSFHYIMYQENIMTYLGWLGVEQTETYAIIKKISKKKYSTPEGQKELYKLKARLVENWKKHTGTEDGFEKTWNIMEAFSKYAFNASHAYSYAYDSVYGAYLKSHYPYEFYSVMMQHLSEKGDKDKVSEYKKEMRNAFGIKEGEYKFRKDNRTFSIDRKEKCINPALFSIKNFSNAIAESLYNMKDMHFDSFRNFLEYVKENSILGDSRIIDLIKIDYFSEFGNMNYLLNYFNTFILFHEKKTYSSLYKKDKAFNLGIDFDVIRKHCKNETPQSFTGLNSIEIVEELAKKFSDVKTTQKEIIQSKFEVMGYVDTIDKKYSGFCIVTDLNVDYSPKLVFYALANGNSIMAKIDKKTFYRNPLKRGDIVKVESQCKKNKKKANGKDSNGKPIFIESEEKEWWITDYKIC